MTDPNLPTTPPATVAERWARLRRLCGYIVAPDRAREALELVDALEAELDQGDGGLAHPTLAELESELVTAAGADAEAAVWLAGACPACGGTVRIAGGVATCAGDFTRDGCGAELEVLDVLGRDRPQLVLVPPPDDPRCVECGEPMRGETSTLNGRPRHIRCPRELRELGIPVDADAPRRARVPVGICVNHRCRRFEYAVLVDGEPLETAPTCSECGWRLEHESGLTWGDAADQGLYLPLRDERGNRAGS